VLVDVGAPGGYALSQDLLVEEHFAYTLNVPEYQGHFEVNVSAEEPDPLNVDLSFLPVIVKSEDYTLRGAYKGKEGLQQFLVIGGGVWVGVHVIPTPERIDIGPVAVWFERVVDVAEVDAPPSCTRG
jgi:hypothetical protein